MDIMAPNGATKDVTAIVNDSIVPRQVQSLLLENGVCAGNARLAIGVLRLMADRGEVHTVDECIDLADWLEKQAAPCVPQDSAMHDALKFVADRDPEPVKYSDVSASAGFDTKTLDRLRTKTAPRRVDRCVVEEPVVARFCSRGGPYEYRMTEAGWAELDRLS